MYTPVPCSALLRLFPRLLLFRPLHLLVGVPGLRLSIRTAEEHGERIGFGTVIRLLRYCIQAHSARRRARDAATPFLSLRCQKRPGQKAV